jgi:hypothetical protein
MPLNNAQHIFCQCINKVVLRKCTKFRCNVASIGYVVLVYGSTVMVVDVVKSSETNFEKRRFLSRDFRRTSQVR